MGRSDQILLFAFSFILSLIVFHVNGANGEDRKIHIVYLGSLTYHNAEYSLPSLHHSLLQQVTSDNAPTTDLIVRSYHRSFNGFAAKLTNQESQKLALQQGVVSVFPSRTLQLRTTRSWDFIGLKETTKRNRTVESDIVIGVIDSGIWPESDSFRDDGFGPAPKTWKGVCNGGNNFTCNNKIVGARYYVDSNEDQAVVGHSARDDLGHGSHSSSIAAGNIVTDVSFYGLEQGTATGGVPSARIAAYKVCDRAGCPEEKILAAFDDAIADGVDIISISIAGIASIDFNRDVIAIGSFHATGKGILTVQAAGNAGPNPGSVSSVAPWLLSVAASTIDRNIIDKVVLGNGRTLTGLSVNSFPSTGRKFPLISGKDASSGCPQLSKEDCVEGCLNKELVRGEIVVCSSFNGVNVAYEAGAAGAITGNDRFANISFVVPLPAMELNSRDYTQLLSYIRSTQNPVAEILKSEVMGDATAPMAAEFSSRGPNQVCIEILKPDITAPGVNIIAAFSPISSPSISLQDKRSVKYAIKSGTSMACPHVAGIAAYVKSFHPDWSPAAIQSAIMTTAKPMDVTYEDTIGEYAHGSGHVDPIRAVDPGLVFEATTEDYIQMLCNLGYDNETLRAMTGEKSTTCPKLVNREWVKNLNYPSMSSSVLAMNSFRLTWNRSVTNVGTAMSTYKVKISPIPKTNITVIPNVLSFTSLKETKSFVVSIAGGEMIRGTKLASSLVWMDGVHNVRTPMVLNIL